MRSCFLGLLLLGTLLVFLWWELAQWERMLTWAGLPHACVWGTERQRRAGSIRKARTREGQKGFGIYSGFINPSFAIQTLVHFFLFHRQFFFLTIDVQCHPKLVQTVFYASILAPFLLSVIFSILASAYVCGVLPQGSSLYEGIRVALPSFLFL